MECWHYLLGGTRSAWVRALPSDQAIEIGREDDVFEPEEDVTCLRQAVRLPKRFLPLDAWEQEHGVVEVAGEV